MTDSDPSSQDPSDTGQAKHACTGEDRADPDSWDDPDIADAWAEPDTIDTEGLPS